MYLTREDFNLVVDEFDDSDLSDMRELCSYEYKMMEEGKVKRDILKAYWMDEGRFVTSMGFLHGFKEMFDCEVDIEPLSPIRLRQTKRLNLWPEQQRAIRDWMRNDRRALLVALTASGKTIVSTHAMLLCQVPTLIVVPTDIIQKDTWLKTMQQKYGIPRERIGLFGGKSELFSGRTYHEIRDITIATYKSAEMYIDELKGKFDLLIADEAHHMAAPTYYKIPLKIGALYRLGVSATVERQDRNEELLYRLVGPRIQGPTEQELLAKGHISRMETEAIFVDLTPKEREKYEALKALSSEAGSMGDRSNREKYRQAADRIAFEAKNKIPVVADLVLRNRSKKILIFSRYLSTVNMLYTLFKKLGAREITSETGNKETLEALKEFHEGKIKVILSAIKIDEGLNVPDADMGIVMAGYGIKRQKVQREGRVRRFYPGKIAKQYEIVTRNTADENLYVKRTHGL